MCGCDSRDGYDVDLRDLLPHVHDVLDAERVLGAADKEELAAEFLPEA